MPLPIGARIGAYEVTGALGAGGMGEVYRARDTRLGREVALKIVSDAFAADPDRLQRFEREARTLAALNHPNIASIHGVEETARALVMEFVDGEDLAARIARGPLPIDDALPLARQIADALDAAHQQGIVHRDLKPANIKIRPDGSVKVLDFGLAKALVPDHNLASGTVTVLPTMTSPALTAMGVILGTAAYMSPEQARGRAVDRRADLWAFGVVLFEMLAGRQMFAGDSITDVLAAVVKEEPDWSALPPETPAPIRRLLRRCLEKDPQRRLRDAADARLDIDDVLSGRGVETGTSSPPATAPPPLASRMRAVIWAASVVAALLIGLLAARWTTPLAPDLPVRRFSMPTPGRERATEAVISPDGRIVAFASAGKAWLQPLDRSEPREIPNSAGARSLFWSPDSTQLGFQTNGALWRVDTVGGTPTRIGAVASDFSAAGGAAWLSDRRIWYTTGNTGLLELPEEGGAARVVLEVDKVTEVDFHHVSALPDGRGVLFVPHRIDGVISASIDVFDGRERRRIFESTSPIRQPAYAPSGHLLFVRDQGVWAIAFSVAEMKTSGEAFLVAADAATPSASADGLLVVIPEGSSEDQQLAWVERGDRVGATIGRSGIAIRSPRLSPNGRSVVATVLGGNVDLYVFDVESGADRRLTFESGPDRSAVWSPDGLHIIYECGPAICSRPADGSGERVVLVPEPAASPTISPDGKWLTFAREQAQTNIDLFVVPLGPTGPAAPPVEPPRPLIATERLQGLGVDFSPDGSLIAYESNETGLSEIYVTTFPRAEGKWQISRNGGGRPLWSRNGDRVFYRSAERIVEVLVSRTPTPSPGAPRDVISGPAIGARLSAFGFDRSLDGSRFLVARSASGLADIGSVLVVEQWSKEHARSRK